MARKAGEEGWRGRLATKTGEEDWRQRLATKTGEEDWRGRLAREDSVARNADEEGWRRMAVAMEGWQWPAGDRRLASGDGRPATEGWRQKAGEEGWRRELARRAARRAGGEACHAQRPTGPSVGVLLGSAPAFRDALKPPDFQKGECDGIFFSG